MSNKDNRTFNESGAKYPFRVPEGYFDSLTARIMDKIPEEEQSATPVFSISRSGNSQQSSAGKKKSSSKLWISTLSIAASLALVVFVSTKMVNKSGMDEPQQTAQVQTADYDSESSYDEALLLYSMADNSDIYDYLAGYDF